MSRPHAPGAPLLLCVLLVLFLPAVASAQGIDGYATALVDAVGREDATDVELRSRVQAEWRRAFGQRVRLRAAGFVEGLVADRQRPSAATDLIAEPQELYAELTGERGDFRLGYSRVVWGRLDELQPTDVVNPLDLATFFFEGRSEARMAVAMARARIFLPASTTLEALVVPQFRRTRFDRLDEPTSAFNLFDGRSPCSPISSADSRGCEKPAVTWSDLQGGGRLQTTTRRLDWSVSAYRGFRSVGVLTVLPTTVESFPRFTMIGGDFEAVRGQWGVRGEVAAFVDDGFQAVDASRVIEGRSLEGGAGADRRVGDFRISGNVLVRRRFTDVPGALLDRSDLNLIASLDRSFRRETRRLQVFGVYDPTEVTGFLRSIFTLSLDDHLALEASAGLFMGSGPDPLGRFAERDFAYVKVKRHF